MKLIIPRQEIEVSQGDEFQVKGSIGIGTAEAKFKLLHAIAEPELFIVCQEQFKDNKKHWIENSMTFHRLGEKYNFGWDDVPGIVSLAEVNQYETGDTIRWDEGRQEFKIGTRARDIYFPEPMQQNGMKGVWANETYLKKIKDAGFDAIIHGLFYARSKSDKAKTLEEAIKYGIQIIPRINTYYRDNNISGAVKLVNAWKNHSAIGGWFLLDEPALLHIPPSEQKKFYNAIKTADPDHILYVNFAASSMPGRVEYYSPEAFDIATVDYYPVIEGRDWRKLLRINLDQWIASTGNKDIIPVMQSFIELVHYGDCRGTIEEQYSFWKERGLTNRGYTLYKWQVSGSGEGIGENSDILAEVTAFNKVK